MAKDNDYSRMISSVRWRRLRRDVLLAHPMCQRCEAEGYVAAATEVHHIVPVESAPTLREKERLMFNRGNLRALCHACHVRTHTELGRSGKALTKERHESECKSFIGRYFNGD